MQLKIIAVLVLVLASISSYAQITVTISGPTSAHLNETKFYEVTWNTSTGLPPKGTGLMDWWTTGGTMVSPTSTTCQVLWTTTGVQTLNYQYETWDNYWYDQHSITVTNPLPATPLVGLPTSLGSSSFVANWGTATNATGYRLDVSTTSNFSNIISGYNNLFVAGTSQNVTGLSAGTTYYYRVRATNASGTSGNSGTASALTIPTAPVASAASSISTTSFIANWSAVVSATSYRLDISTSSSFSSFISGYNNLSVTGTSRSVTGLTSGATYYYRLRAVNASGTSGNSNSSSVVTVPPAPLANAATSVTASSFTANWSSVPTASSYRLDISTSSAFSSFISGYNNLSVTGTNRSVTGLSSGTTYYYRLRTVNASGTSGNSNVRSVVTIPAAPAVNAGSTMTASSFTANWSAVASATGYRLDVSTSSSFSSFVSGYNNLSVTGISQSVAGLAPGTTYHYRVRAVNGSGTSANSGTRSVLTVPAPPSASNATNITTTSFTANWGTSTSATGYRLDVSTSSSFSSFVSGYNNRFVAGTSHNVTGLNSGTKYYYRFRAENASGASASTDGPSLYTLPDVPVAYAATGTSSTSFIANWSTVPNANYQLDVSTSSSFSSFVQGFNGLSISTTSANVTGLSPGGTYYYRVRAVVSGHASANSNTQTAVCVGDPPQVQPATGITENSFTAQWQSVPSASGYRLDVSATSSFSSFVPGYSNLIVSSTSQVVEGLSPGTTYYYRVRSENNAGISGNSATVTLITVPAAPASLSASGIRSETFLAGWAPSASATGYRLDVSQSYAFVNFVDGFNDLAVTGTSHGVTGLESGTTYYFRVRAVNVYGISDHSQVQTVLTAPGAPMANAPTDINATSFIANWASTASATGYRLDVSTSESFDTFVSGYNNLSLTGTSRNVTGLAAGTIYYYRVRAENGGGASGNSNTMDVLLRPLPPIANAPANVSTSSFTANWSSVPTAYSYRLDVSTSNTFDTYLDGYQNLGVTAMSRVVSGLVPGTQYYYRVRAVNTSGLSINSAVVSVTTIPPPPVALMATNIMSSGFNANWEAGGATVTGYRLDVSRNSTFTDLVAGYSNLQITGANFSVVNGLQADETYYYRVRAFNEHGTSDNSGTITVTTDEFKALYNGLITSARWRTDPAFNTGSSELKGMYLYSYDDKYQLRMASWAEPDFTLNTFARAGDKFKVINGEYDPNGNILKMLRHNEVGGVQHNFEYRYNERNPADPLDNQLEQIPGYATYHYNKIGQLTEEEKTVGDNQYIEYDVTGKVRKVFASKTGGTFTDLKVEYMYDDRGFRLAKVNHETQRTTWYIRDASGNIISVYEQEGVVVVDQNDVPVVKTEPLEQTEVPVYGSGKLGVFHPGQNGSTTYEITDHLGNVRALLRDNTNTFVATMEDTDQADVTNPRVEEMQYFENLFETEDENINMNHTAPIPGIVDAPDQAAYLYWVNGMTGMEATDKSVGPSIALQVRPGDVVEIETWAKFERKASYNRNVLLTTLSAFLGNTFAGQTGFEGLTAQQTADNLYGALFDAEYPSDGTDTEAPYAYLNYILFDENMTMVDADWRRVTDDAGFDPPESGIPGGHEHLKFDAPIQVTQKGYIYIWVSNQSEQTRVWFDDLTVKYSGVHVTQATDYGAWGDVIREQKYDEQKYRHGYQGQFAEKDEETGWNHFELRQFDAIIGRWAAKDPYGQYYSPYVGMGNDPVNGIDPDGGFRNRLGAWLYSIWNGGGDVERSIDPKHYDEWYVGNHGFSNAAVTYNRVFDWGNGNKTFAQHAWNHPFTRFHISDFYAVGIGYSGYAGVGGGTSFELNWVVRGPEASLLPIVSVTQSVGVGQDVDATFNITQSNYLGDVREIRASMIATRLPQINGFANIGVSKGIELAVGINAGLTETGRLLVGRSASIGIGIPGGHWSVGANNTFILHSFSGHK